MSKTPPKPTKVVCELPDPVQLQPAIPHVKGDGNKDLPVSKFLRQECDQIPTWQHFLHSVVDKNIDWEVM